MLGSIKENKTGRRAKYIVRFKTVFKRFNDLDRAERFLTGLRFQQDQGTFDERDWQRSQPLGFTVLSDKWLGIRKGQVRCFRNLRNHIGKAQLFYGQKNIKSIRYADLEDFLVSLHGLSSKSRKDVFTTLHTFWVWCEKRGYVKELPEWPKIKVTLGWRNTIDKATQLAVIEEVKRISYHINPKIWLGIKWLATYYEIRPVELIHIKEKDINYDTGTVFVRYTKTDDPKIIYFLQDDLATAISFGHSFANMFFFRHIKGNGMAKAGNRFGSDYLRRWWKKACANLQLAGVDLYGGTRHSTIRALAEEYTPEQIKRGGWKTNKAFDRYLGPVDQEQKRAIYRMAQGEIVNLESLNSNTTQKGIV